MVVLTAFALIPIGVFSQSNEWFGSDGWAATESDNICDKTNPSVYNVTGSVTVDGFNPPASLPNSTLGNLTSLTISYGVIDYLESWNSSKHSVESAYWLQPSPLIDMASASLPYAGCSSLIAGLPRQVYVNGMNDTGDCSTLFNSACISALLNNAKNGSMGFQGTNVNSSQCTSLIWPPPAECKQFTSNGNWVGAFGSLPPGIFSLVIPTSTAVSYLTLPIVYIGSGDSQALPNTSYCSTTGAIFAMTGDIDPLSYELGDNSQYDFAVTEITPLMTTVWSKDMQNAPWSDARLVCIHADRFRIGSLVPTAVPSFGVRGSSYPDVKTMFLGFIFWLCVLRMGN